MPSAPPGRFTRILRVGLALLLTAAASEAALRLAGHLYLQKLYTTAFRSLDPLPGDVNVLCLGESSTAGLGVEPVDSYPGQLEALLREFYDDPRIRTLVPPHVGQNTSQIANRIDDYLELYRPRLVVVMAGYNNEWSLAESHVLRFLEGPPAETWRVRALVSLDRFRLFKLLRYGYLRFVARERSAYMAENVHYVWGHPELVRFPPAAWLHEFARDHSLAFVRAWREDLGEIVRASRARGARVLLMTYHVNPSYLLAIEFASLAAELHVPLVRNDESFEALVRRQGASRYLLGDGWHPNRLGYEIIARNAFQRIRDADLLGLVGAASRSAADDRPGWDEAPPSNVPPLGGRLALGNPSSAGQLGRGWSDPERSFRWTDGPRAEVFFRLDAQRTQLLRVRLAPFLVTGRLDSQRVELALNGRPIAQLQLSDPAPAEHRVVLPDHLLGRANALSLLLPDRRSPQALGLGEDQRELGVAVEWLAIEDFPEVPEDGISPGSQQAERYLGGGWGQAEGSYRWTDGPTAVVFFRTSEAGAGVLHFRLQPFLPTGQLARQRMGVELDGEPLAWFSLVSPGVQSLALPTLGSGRDRRLVLRLPDARSPTSLGERDDTRALGVAVSSIRWEPFPRYVPGNRVALASVAAESHLARGWSAPRGSYRWARPPKAEFVFRVEPPHPAFLRLKAHGFTGVGGARNLAVTIQLNGDRVAHLRLTATDPFPTTYALPLARETLAVDNVLTFGFPSDAAPGATEQAGLALEWLELVPGSGEP